MADAPADPASLTDVQRQSITERATVAADAGCLPAISGGEWLALLAERDRLAVQLAATRAGIVAAIEAKLATLDTEPPFGRDTRLAWRMFGRTEGIRIAAGIAAETPSTPEETS